MKKVLLCTLVLAACRRAPSPPVALTLEEPAPAAGELALTAYDGGAGPAATVHRTVWVDGQDGYTGMEDNDLRGHLDGSFKYGWNQVGQNHVRVGRREKSSTWGECEIFRVLQRWGGIVLPAGAVVRDASLDLAIESGPHRPMRLYLYEVHRDWNPGQGGVLGDNVSPPRPGEVWWGDAGYREKPWGHPGAGLASDADPEADTPVMPLAEALYTPEGNGLTFRSEALAAYATRRIAAGLPLLFLLKVSDALEDLPTGSVVVYSANQGDDRNGVRRPRLTLTWSAPGERFSVEKPLLLEYGRTLTLPPIEAAALRAVAATFRPGEAGACGPQVEWRADGGPWSGAGVGVSGPWSRLEVRVVAACDPVPLGSAFETTFRNTWVRTAPPERQHVPFVFRGPDGTERVVPARYAGDYRWTVSFTPDEPGRWTYAWGETFTTEPYRSATGTFDVLVDPGNLDAQLARLAEDARAWDRKGDPARGEVLSTRLARLERAAAASLSGSAFLRDGGAALRRRLNVARSALDAPVPDVLPMKPDKPPSWKREGSR
ncbi:MAG TPA: DUF5060 domain-containing protein [Candidatus Polarisedimenticolaceae bacterium]|nr:DUF5060 domain-containing protein [Candidatus Polarisedimenticolaceae bacterium]